MIKLDKVTKKARGCNACPNSTMDGKDIYEVSFGDPTPSIVVALCADCLYELHKTLDLTRADVVITVRFCNSCGRSTVHRNGNCEQCARKEQS